MTEQHRTESEQRRPAAESTPPTTSERDHQSSDDPSLTAYDKEVADSFPASDPPTQP